MEGTCLLSPRRSITAAMALRGLTRVAATRPRIFQCSAGWDMALQGKRRDVIQEEIAHVTSFRHSESVCVSTDPLFGFAIYFRSNGFRE